VPGIDGHKDSLVVVHTGPQETEKYGLKQDEEKLHGNKQPGLLTGEKMRIMAATVEEQVAKVYFAIRLSWSHPIE